MYLLILLPKSPPIHIPAPARKCQNLARVLVIPVLLRGVLVNSQPAIDSGRGLWEAPWCVVFVNFMVTVPLPWTISSLQDHVPEPRTEKTWSIGYPCTLAYPSASPYWLVWSWKRAFRKKSSLWRLALDEYLGHTSLLNTRVLLGELSWFFVLQDQQFSKCGLPDQQHQQGTCYKWRFWAPPQTHWIRNLGWGGRPAGIVFMSLQVILMGAQVLEPGSWHSLFCFTHKGKRSR